MTPWIFLAVLFNAVLATDQTRAELERKVLMDIYLHRKFHSFVRPHVNESLTDDPISVHVNLYILQLHVDGKSQKYDISLYFRQEWNDSRLAYDNAGKLNHIVIHDVVGFWTPDLFFVDETNAHLHTVTKPNMFAKIYPDGGVLHSQRLSIKSSCPMDLKRYPFDSQKCHLRIESYGYTMDDVILQWKTGDKPPVEGSPQVVGYDTTYSYSNSTSTVGKKKYSILQLEISLRRQPLGFILHIYIPLALFVITSWISFWMSPDISLIRLVVCLTTLVASLLQLNMNNYLFLTPGYPTGLDVWVAVSCTFLFASFFENVCSVYMYLQAENKYRKNPKSSVTPLIGPLSQLSRRFDTVSKLLFPSLYGAFHVFYIIYIVI